MSSELDEKVAICPKNVIGHFARFIKGKREDFRNSTFPSTFSNMTQQEISDN